MGENMSVLINKLYKMKSIKRQNTNNDLKSPNWNTIPTKGMNVPSDKELEVKIKELARREAHAKTDREFNEIEQERKQLNAQYLSKVSPDRKALYKDVLEEVNKSKYGNNSKKTKPLSELNLVNILMEKENGKRETYLKSGGFLEEVYNSNGGYEYNIKVNNNVVLGTINGNWTYALTPAEQVRQTEFNNIYYNSCQAEKNEQVKGNLRPSSYFKNGNIESTFDIKA